VSLVPASALIASSAILLTSGLTTGCSRNSAQAAAPSVKQPVVTVATVKPERGAANSTVNLTGNSVPYEQVTLYSQTSGYLRDLKADIGDRVRAGELLATIETPVLSAALGEKRVASQRARVTTDVARAAIDRAHAEAVFAKLTFDRLQAIRTRDPEVLSQQDVDQARSNLDVARAKERTAALDAESAETGVMGAKAEIATLETQIGFGQIRSPLSGIVTERFVDAGALIQVATSSRTQAAPIVTVSRVKRLRILFDVPEAQAAEVQVGMPTRIRIGGKTFDTRVTRLTKLLDPSSHTMRTEVDLNNGEEQLRPGMTAAVALTLNSVGNALLVPVSAVHSIGSAHSVFVVVGGVARELQVRTGVEMADRIEISQGLRGGEDVVVAAAGMLKDGVPVQVRQ